MEKEAASLKGGFKMSHFFYDINHNIEPLSIKVLFV